MKRNRPEIPPELNINSIRIELNRNNKREQKRNCDDEWTINNGGEHTNKSHVMVTVEDPLSMN